MQISAPVVPPHISLPVKPQRQTLASVIPQILIVGVVYAFSAIFASLFNSMCGPGCCFVFYTILAVVSGALMLSKSILIRSISFAMLVIFLYGMWHEKEVRDTHRERFLKHQIEQLHKSEV